MDKALQPNQVKLSDGRVVTFREQKGSDELIVAGELGGLIDGTQAGNLIMMNALLSRTIISIDDKANVAPKGYEALRDFMDGFKFKDWTRLKVKYMEINGDDEGNDEK